MVMLSREGANEVAACFLARYYAELVQRGNMPLNLTDLYDDESHVLLANIEESTPVVVQGKANVALHLSKLDSILSKRKVEVISADSVPLPDGGVEIVCQGILFLTGSRRVFIQVFVLVPTAYRPDTYHIASDYLRFVNAEAELIPEHATVVTQEQMAAHLAQQLAQAQAQALAQQQQAQQQAAAAREHVAIPAPASQQRQHKPAEAAHPQRRSAEPQAHGHPQRRSAEPQQQHRAEGERPAPRERPVREHKEERPVRERPPRQEREKPESRRERLPRYGEEKKEAAAKAADAKPAASASPKERPERAPRGNNNSHSNNASAASANATEFVRFCNVPVDVKLSDIKEQLKKEDAETKDAFWCGQDRKHAVVEVIPDVSRRLLKKGTFIVLTHEVKAVKYTP